MPVLTQRLGTRIGPSGGETCRFGHRLRISGQGDCHGTYCYVNCTSNAPAPLKTKGSRRTRRRCRYRFEAADLPPLDEALMVEWDRPENLIVEVQAHLDEPRG